MALVRISALKDFRSAALSTTDVSTGYDFSTLFSAGQRIYGALHLTSVLGGTTARVLDMRIQSATASGFGAAVDRITFTRSTAIGAQWGTPIAGPSTEHKWWRANWAMTTGASTAGTWKGLVHVGFK